MKYLEQDIMTEDEASVVDNRDGIAFAVASSHDEDESIILSDK